jgi:uncharacterized protein YjlB
METLNLKRNGDIPNNPVLPVLIYRQVLSADEDCSMLFEKAFQENHWHGFWRDGIFDYHHFHSGAHEVLGVIHGHCRIQFGGMGGPVADLEAGDMVVLPAGTGHKDAGSDDDLVVIGGYPIGQIMDVCKSLKNCPHAETSIVTTPLPLADPFYGETGSLLRYWKKSMD